MPQWEAGTLVVGCAPMGGCPVGGCAPIADLLA